MPTQSYNRWVYVDSVIAEVQPMLTTQSYDRWVYIDSVSATVNSPAPQPTKKEEKSQGKINVPALIGIVAAGGIAGIVIPSIVEAKNTKKY